MCFNLVRPTSQYRHEPEQRGPGGGPRGAREVRSSGPRWPTVTIQLGKHSLCPIQAIVQPFLVYGTPNIVGNVLALHENHAARFVQALSLSMLSGFGIT